LNKTILSTIAVLMLTTVALADSSSLQSSSMGLLENQWVKAGINKDSGTFGSGGNTSPGLLFDPTGTGTFNPSYDYLTPGSPFDGQSLKIDGTNYVNNNQGASAITASGGLVDGTDSLTWTGSVASWIIENIFTLPDNQPYVDVTTRITAGSAASSVWYSKFIDPDSQGMPGDSSATDNVLGYGTIPIDNVVFSEATVSRYALGLYSTDPHVSAGINMWSTQADSYVNADIYGSGTTYGNGDHTIGLSWYWSGVSVGDILEANYAYIFGPSAFGAASSAVTGGAGGGLDVTGGAGVTDVGSATDAASGGGATPVITTETVINSALPVLTASITSHTSTVANGVQTIARELTTTTTTPMVTITYTDGVETSRVAATSVVSTAVTYPASFVGRVDQVKILSTDLQKLRFKAGIVGIHNEAMYLGAGKQLNGDATLAFGIVRKDDDNKIGVSIENNGLSFAVAKVMSTHQYSRTIGTFSNSGTAFEDGYELVVGYSSDKKGLSPVLGLVLGSTTVQAWDEIGSVQSKLAYDEINQSYNVLTLGMAYNTDKIGVAASYNTTSEVDLALKVKNLEVSMARDIDSSENSFGLGYNIKF
jgi:hypothetical protein